MADFALQYDNTEELLAIYANLKGIEKRAKTLHRLFENACNADLTPRQQTREKNLRELIILMADRIGFKVYFQTDPRGLPVYLVDKDNLTPETNYSTNGVCVWEK